MDHVYIYMQLHGIMSLPFGYSSIELAIEECIAATIRFVEFVVLCVWHISVNSHNSLALCCTPKDAKINTLGDIKAGLLCRLTI